MSSLHEFATWEPVLRIVRAGNADRLATPGSRVTGRLGRSSWSLPRASHGRASDPMGEFGAVRKVTDTFAETGAADVSFVVEIAPDGRTVLRVLESGPAVEPGIGGSPGALLLVEGAVPEPWRRLPEPVPGAVPAPSADPALLERTLRERLPDAVGATEAEIAETEARLGMELPEEVKVLYRVTRAHWKDWDGDYDNAMHVFTQVGCEVLPLSEMYVADAASRGSYWPHAAMEAVETPPDAAVQGLVGSPGWLVFGDNGGGDRIAVDLTPGPAGHLRQIIMISHEGSVGAALIADSLTDMVLERSPERHGGSGAESRAVAYVNHASVPSVEAAAHPDLEALHLGAWKKEKEPFSLEPLFGLPRLRTLGAYPGTLADPLEIARLTGLEFLKLCPEDWRVLLDAGAVPRSLLAADVEVRSEHDPLAITALANEILALWDRPLITETIVEGDLGPME